jgi:hypothetical protein
MDIKYLFINEEEEDDDDDAIHIYLILLLKTKQICQYAKRYDIIIKESN